MKSWIGGALLGSLGFIAIGFGVGAVYESTTRSELTARFPVQGKLVDIGGRRLQLDCRGAGSPLVVFESGLDTSGSLSWSPVHDLVAKTTRACSYSRAGILWSDRTTDRRDAHNIANELHLLLTRAGETLPAVLVAHSIGGAYALTYAQKFASEVAGMVLVDAAHPDMKKRMVEVDLHLKPPFAMLKVMNAVAWTGLVRVVVGSNVPEDAFVPTALPTLLAEVDASDQSLEQSGAVRQLGSLPLFVLTAGQHAASASGQMTPEQLERYQRLWQDLQTDMASWSTHTQHETVDGAQHQIHEDHPDRVVAAVKWVVEMVQKDTESRKDKR